MSIIPENKSTTESTTPNVARPGYTEDHCVDQDTLVLPEGAMAGLTTAQVALITTDAVKAARRAPRLAPPSWVMRGPDSEGNYDGPACSVNKLHLSCAWSARDGAAMWLDTVLDDSGDMTPDAARQLAHGLLRMADLVEQANTPAADGGSVTRFMTDAERAEFDAKLAADAADFQELLQAPVELADRLSPVPSSFAAAASAGGAR